MKRFLYYAKFWQGSDKVYKIGITRDAVERMASLTPKDWNCLLLMVEAFSNEDDARQAESLVKRSFKEERVFKYFSRHTETFGRDVLGLDVDN